MEVVMHRIAVFFVLFACLGSTSQVSAQNAVEGGQSVVTGLSSPSVMEGDAGTTNMTFVLTVDCQIALNMTLDWETADDTATLADNDYVQVTAGAPAPGQLPNVCPSASGAGTTYDLVVPIVGDVNFEPDETVRVNLTGASVGEPSFSFNGITTSLGTILNDDANGVDIAVSIGENIDPVIAGSGANNLVYSITVSNNGPGDATGIEVDGTIDWPAGVSPGACFVVAAQDASMNFSDATEGSGTFDIDGSITAGGSVQVDCPLTVGPSAAAGTDVVTASASVTTVDQADLDPLNDSATESTSIGREVDIALTSMESIDPVVAGSGGGNLIHTITATNNGPSDSSGVAASATITFPANVTLDDVDPSGSGIWSGTNPGTWTIGNLPAGASETLTVTFTATSSAAVGTDVIDTSANVSAVNETDTNNGNDATQVATSVERQIDLTVTKTDDPDPVVAGFEIGGLEYVVTVTNNGPSDGDGVVINDPAAAFPAGVTLENAVASAGMYDNTDWVVDLATGASATLTMTVTVGPTAPIGPDAISNTAAVTGSGGGETIINTGDDSATETTTVEATTATWTVTKDFLDDSAASVTATLACSSGTVITPPAQVSEGNPADLTVEGFLMGPFGTTTCEVTESNLPPDYFQVSASADCAVDGVVHQDVFDCEFVNAPIRATFEVTKDFSDDNPADVRVVIECNTGLPLMQEAMLSEFGMPFDHIKFIVQDYEVGTLNCDVFEEPVPTGYQQDHTASFDPVDALFGTVTDDENGCYYTEIETGTFGCDITNTLLPVDVTVNKEWIDDRPEFQNPTWVEIAFSCNAPIVEDVCDAAAGGCGFNGDPVNTVYTHIDPDNPGEFLVLPHWDGSTVCSATEEPQSGVIQDQDDCAAIPLAPGVGGECTLVNTRFYEGIPTLSQYGLMLLSLLMLGMGMIAYRRFV